MNRRRSICARGEKYLPTYLPTYLPSYLYSSILVSLVVAHGFGDGVGVTLPTTTHVLVSVVVARSTTKVFDMEYRWLMDLPKPRKGREDWSCVRACVRGKERKN
ncbi:uncharacterized protein BO80DRAFT_288382 [Aspergillus ibericus CBS 121593]|uniref:Uncharacterized protein n=1 Tax=Aspergillus ibericus CBS 121593 TaxID=1448316 RepID=A0A395H6Q3_9EURO|nr:hypothetical protein BO80DRAFT_288382 [Aspergillus ibericus CBS 121593]RAL03611.1 hypothetical protein BO80DRAFT_288382 [Aspergillus ibericus CBS 121593]